MKTLTTLLIALSLVSGTILSASQAKAAEPIRIEIGKNYDRYSNEELRRRVYDLERAVAQLQAEVFHLSVRDRLNPTYPAPAATPAKEWTCTLQAFATTYVGEGSTRAKALASVIKQCSDATNAIHCKDSDAKCDDK